MIKQEWEESVKNRRAQESDPAFSSEWTNTLKKRKSLYELRAMGADCTACVLCLLSPHSREQDPWQNQTAGIWLAQCSGSSDAGGWVGRWMDFLQAQTQTHVVQGENVAISREMRCHSSLVCLPLFRFCSTSLNCIMPTGVKQKAPRALRMMLTKSS